MNAFLDEKYVSIFPGNDKSNLRNSLFDPKKNTEWNLIFVHLKKFLKQKNVDINTYDISTNRAPYKYVYFDLPYPFLSNFPIWKLIFLNRQNNILMCLEPPTIIPFSYMKIFHLFFTKVYTWNNDLVDNEQSSSASKKYFKIYLPQHNLELNTTPKKFKNKEFLVLINSNKSSFFPFKTLSPFGKELYSERIKAIEFFEKKIPDKFSLYGHGWNKPKKYNLKEFIFGFKKYSTYRGAVADKIKLLSNFKYCLCFENLTNVNGYITEKIFDCFKAKCVPIYWGASNVEKYIPKKCFIDFRDFGDYKKLLTFLTSINEARYNQYIKNIEKLLKDKKFIALWSENGYSNFFLSDVLEI